MRLAPKLCLSACALIAVIAPNAQTLSDQVTVTSLSGPTYIYEANKTITTNGTVTATSGTTVSFVA
ncbi:MAG: hypothetical protein JO336_11465, partial [Acidobacteriia bacterium]|nr:hypothetical protein [Terriglobia bacterium]MBV8905119.1 hypothetical protein [Terriglobia bacterium]